MENERDAERVMVDVTRAGKVVKTMLMIGNPATMLLLTFLKRMVKQKLLKTGEFDKIESFINATKGNYDIINVPVAQSGTIGQYWGKREMAKELEAMGVSFSILPDLDRSDGIIQIAVADKDSGKFSAWFSRHIMSQMQGGEKTNQDLQNLTDGQMSIISFPFEGQEHIFRDDFESLGINYSVLPDLNVGDNEIQLYVANSDLRRVEHWYGMYKAECLNSGEDIPDMQIISAERYMETGRLSEEAYINTADEKVRAANNIYEGKEPGAIENAVGHSSNAIRSIDHEAFSIMDQSDDYVKVTINHETLVEKCSMDEIFNTEESTFFASRIPGTWGNHELTLLVDKEDVFKTDDGKTYIAFLQRNEANIMMDHKGDMLPLEKRMTGAELKQKHYDKVKRKFKDIEAMAGKEKGLDAAKETVKGAVSDRAPSNPIKLVSK